MEMELVAFSGPSAVADVAAYCIPFIEAAADAKRNSYIREGDQVEHRSTYLEAVAYVAASYPFANIADYPFLWGTADGQYQPSASEAQIASVADAIKSQGDALYGTVLPAIKRERERIVDLAAGADAPSRLALTTNIIESIAAI